MPLLAIVQGAVNGSYIASSSSVKIESQMRFSSAALSKLYKLKVNRKKKSLGEDK